MNASGISMEGAMTLIEFARQSELLNGRLDTRAKLEAEIKRVLIYSVGFQSQTLSGTATEYSIIQQRAMEEYYANPVFHAFIDKQCMELMLIIDRYEPR